MPQSDVEIRWTILFHNPFYHSAAAFRRAVFAAAGGYRSEERVSQDHYLWFQMLPLCRARNLGEPLVRYRLNSQGLTALHAAGRPRQRTHPIREAEWAGLGLTYDLQDDALAVDITQFLRGHEIAASERRAPAYRKLLAVLRAFVTAPRSGGRPDDAADARRLARGLVVRILGSPPANRRERLAVWRDCWAVDKGAALKAWLGTIVGTH